MLKTVNGKIITCFYLIVFRLFVKLDLVERRRKKIKDDYVLLSLIAGEMMILYIAIGI